MLVVLALLAMADPAPEVEVAPNIYGQTGVVRVTSAQPGGSGVIDVGANGFVFLQNDFLVPGNNDFDAYVGGNLSLSAALFNIVEISLASRAASNSNTAREPAQFSVGDLYPSLKLGYGFGPVVLGFDTRLLLPTRVDRAGFDFNNISATFQGLVTLDMKSAGIPLQVHLNGGYVFQAGKYSQGDKGKFEDNPNFYDGLDGQLLALPADQWFYDQVVGGLAVEVPLPYATPFVETWYQTAVGVPANRGAGHKPYDFVNDAHLIVTPGVRLTPGGGITFDLGVDIGLLGTGGGGTDLKKVVDGTPINPSWAARVGVTYTFDPFHGPAGSSTSSAGADTGQIKGCVSDDGGHPIPSAIVTGPALGGARIATDEAGCFLTPSIASGDVQLNLIEKPGYDKMTVAASVEKNKINETTAKLKGGSSSGGALIASSGGSARIVGYVTNKEDETIDADLELWDSQGVKSAGKAIGGAFDLQASGGSVDIVAKADGYLAQGASLVVPGGGRARVAIVLKKAGKVRKATLERDKIATASKVPFEFKKPRMQSTAEYVLDDVIDVLLRNPNLKVRVDVYAEPLASPEESQKLADDRASAVVDYLTSHGVWPARLTQKGTALAAAGESDKSRRVEFVIVP